MNVRHSFFSAKKTEHEQAVSIYQQGVTAYKNAKIAEAIALFTQASPLLKDTDSLALCNSALASCYRDKLEFDQAIRFCEIAISLNDEGNAQAKLAEIQTRRMHYDCARYGLAVKKQQFPYGGINRKDVYDAMQNANPAELAKQISLLNAFRDETEKGSQQDSGKVTALGLQMKGGYCGELSHITRSYIQAKFPHVPVEIVDLNMHQLIIIGRKKGKPNDLSTWGKDAFILDPWTDEIYPVTQFLQKQAQKQIIPFYLFRDKTIPLLSREPYLVGTPSIFPGTNAHQDEVQEIKSAVTITKGARSTWLISS